VGDCLAEIETDKSTMGFDMIDDGFIAKLLYPEGDADIPTGTVMAILVEEKADIEKFANFVPTTQAQQKQEVTPVEEVVKAPEPEPEPVQQKAPEENKATTTGGANRKLSGEKLPNLSLGQGAARVLMSPLAKRLALENNIEIASLDGIGTGPNGRVIAENVEAFLSNISAEKLSNVKKQDSEIQNIEPVKQTATISQASPSDVFEDFPLGGMRKITASRLLESKQTIPHYYLNMDCQMDNLISFRKTMNETSPIKLSVSDLIIKAVAMACTDVPEGNSQFMGNTIRQYNQVNVGFALATPGGLLVPVINDAGNSRLSQIAAHSKDLINRGREGKLKPNEYTGGTVTISNLGMMGISNFCAIINPPQSLILAIGKTDRVPKECQENENGIKWVSQMTVTASFDHRVVDGAVGALWLNSFKGYIENPMTMLL